MKKHIPCIIICLLLASPFLTIAQTVQYYQTGEEFSGPLNSWKNVKTVFGAMGDGVTNDAPAINAALLAMKNSAADSFNVLYFPAGTYLINDSLYNPGNGYDGMTIVGEDPATTIISWNGNVGGSMFYLTGWYLKVSRLTFEGNNSAGNGIFKAGGFSTHNEFSDIIFKDFNNGIGLNLSGTNAGQAENAILRCTFTNCASGICSCNWNSLDQWVFFCLFQDCGLAINQCIGYFQIYNNVFLRSKTYDIGSSPYKDEIVNNTSINSKCFYNGTAAYIRGNKIYSNVDSFLTNAGSNTVMLDNIIRTTQNAWAVTRTGTNNMFVGNTFSDLNSKWHKWPFQPPFNPRSHGIGSGFVINNQIEKGIDGNPATSYACDVAPFGIKWNCPMGSKRIAVKYTISAPPSAGGKSPKDFQLMGSNDWGYTWDILDIQSNQVFTGGGNPVSYSFTNTTPYAMYQLLGKNPWQNDAFGGRSIFNTGAESGTYCEQMVLSWAPRNVYQNIAVKADTSYLASGWMKSNAVNTNGTVEVYWYNTPNPPPFISGYPAPGIQVDTVGVITGTNGWTQYSKTLIAPATAMCATFYLASLSTPTCSGTVWFDNFSFGNAANPGNNLLLDPDFESGVDQGAFQVNEFTLLDAANSDLTKDTAGFVSGANEPWGDFYAFGNTVLDTSAIPFPATVSLPGAPKNMNRNIYNVVKGTGNDATAIQSQINAAALEPLGNKPIVHIPIGTFNVNTTLTVPAGSDMQIVGDGLGTGVTTRINWSGNQTGPLMLLQGPSRATLKDLLLNVPYGAYVGPEALVIQNADQVGGRIYGNQFNAGGPQWTQPCDVGLLADQIENSDITMTCFYPGFGNTAMVKAIGGPTLSGGGNTNGQISLLAGATGDCQNLFGVANGGRIDAEGMWNEGDWARTSGLINLSNCSGKVSLACMSWILLTQTAYPMIGATNFSGTLTLMLNHIDQESYTNVPITGDGTNLSMLSAFNDFGASNTKGYTADSTWQDLTAPNANSDFISNTGGGGRPLDDVISKVHNVRGDSTSIINDLAQLRAVRTSPPNDMGPGVTDVKLFHIACWGTQGHVGAHFYSSSAMTSVGPEQTKKASLVFLFPTVVNTNYTVSYSFPQDGITSMTLLDVSGRVLSQQKIEDPSGGHLVNCQADKLEQGTYFLRVESGSFSETKKFVVVH